MGRVRIIAATLVHLEPVVHRVHVDRHLHGVSESIHTSEIAVPIESPNIIDLAEVGHGVLIVGETALHLSLVHHLVDDAALVVSIRRLTAALIRHVDASVPYFGELEALFL